MLTPLTKTLSSNLTIQDKIRLYLNQVGQRNISTTIEDLAKNLELPENTVYQAINRFRQNGEIEIEKETLPNGREKIIGLTINKLEPTGRTYRKAIERSGRVIRIRPDDIPVASEVPAIPNITDYLQKKLAVENMKEAALKAGLDESVIAFDPDPMGEEGLILLKLFTEQKEANEKLVETNQQLVFERDAEKRNAAFYENKWKEHTQQELRKGLD